MICFPRKTKFEVESMNNRDIQYHVNSYSYNNVITSMRSDYKASSTIHKSSMAYVIILLYCIVITIFNILSNVNHANLLTWKIICKKKKRRKKMVKKKKKRVKKRRDKQQLVCELS